VEPLLIKGALLAQSPALFEELEDLDENDRTAVREEITHRFKLPRTLYFTIVLNSVAAAIQGWDQTGYVCSVERIPRNRFLFFCFLSDGEFC
jgi:hypothetical protein